jgi:hypothetical protein
VSLQRFSFDPLIGAGEKRLEDCQPERLSGLEIEETKDIFFARSMVAFIPHSGRGGPGWQRAWLARQRDYRRKLCAGQLALVLSHISVFG